MAVQPGVPEVTLLFGEALPRGNRATKVDASGLDAFDPPRFPPLAEIGIDVVVNYALVRAAEGSPGLTTGTLGNVAAVRLFPGFSASILANMCGPPLQGLVIEAYGAGNGPSEDREFLAAIEAAASGASSGCRHTVRPWVGAAGGVRDGISADPSRCGARLYMTCEAALTKPCSPARPGSRRRHGRTDDATRHRR